ncbi:MAG: stage III sporulation protein AE [Oscillospiraceae bacterium]|nr:stage III sporulation protein AE [Oscillospiraceae bacterium]
MRKIIILMLILSFLVIPVSAVEFTAPEVPDSGKALMPSDTETFGEGLWKIIKNAISAIYPDLAEAGKTCLKVFAAVLLMSLLHSFSGISKRTVELSGTLAVSWILLSATNSLLNLAADTVIEISDYGKLLLPVMTGAMAAQGGFSASAALYAGTAFFDVVLSTAISNILIPLVYVFVALAVANSALGEDLLNKLQDFVKWLTTWCLKTILYVFTGYMGITGAISGGTDAATLKATKLTISGMVPVVGGILSDASEAVLVGAGLMKNAAGIYGLLAMLAIWIGPFLKIGIQYLLLKLTAAICSVFDTKRTSQLIQDFSGTMGLLLGMTGSVCLLMLISTVCFLKGVG